MRYPTGTPLSCYHADNSPVSDDAYGVSWDAVTDECASKNALYDYLSGLAGGHDAVTLTALADKFLSLSTQEIDLQLTDPGADRLIAWDETPTDGFAWLDYSSWDTDSSDDFDSDPDSLNGDTNDDDKVDVAIIPSATPSNGDTTHFSTADHIYDYLVANYAPLTSPTFATSITGSYLTASELLGTNASKNIVSLAVATYPSLAELIHVKGVTSEIQTQIDGKEGTLTNEAGLYAALSDVTQFYEAGDEDTIAGLITTGIDPDALDDEDQGDVNISSDVWQVQEVQSGAISEAADIDNDIITHAQILDSDQALTICGNFYESDGIDATDDIVSWWANKTANDFTITELWCETDTGTVTAMVQVDDGSPADIDGTDIVCDADEQEDTSLDGDTEIAAGEEVDWAVTSTASTPLWVHWCITGNWKD